LQETLEAKNLIMYEGPEKPRLPPIPTKPAD